MPFSSHAPRIDCVVTANTAMFGYNDPKSWPKLPPMIIDLQRNHDTKANPAAKVRRNYRHRTRSRTTQRSSLISAQPSVIKTRKRILFRNPSRPRYSSSIQSQLRRRKSSSRTRRSRFTTETNESQEENSPPEGAGSRPRNLCSARQNSATICNCENCRRQISKNNSTIVAVNSTNRDSA